MTQLVRATAYGFHTADGFDVADGVSFDLPANTHGLDAVHALLRNGRNVKVTLHKDDGGRVEYTLPPQDGSER